jgi:hypothetical protein
VPLYLAEAAGARLVQAGAGHTVITASGTDDALLDVQTWDQAPAGPVGDCVFRSVDVVIRHDAGFSIGITPILDGVSLSEQTFNGSSPEAGTDGVVALQAFVADRGTRIAARIRQIDATGTLELVDAGYSFTVIRATP